MVKHLYVIYNVLEEAVSPPMVCASDKHAHREFSLAMENLPKHMNPKEFSLYHIGCMQQEFPWRIDYHAPIALVSGSVDTIANTGESNE